MCQHQHCKHFFPLNFLLLKPYCKNVIGNFYTAVLWTLFESVTLLQGHGSLHYFAFWYICVLYVMLMDALLDVQTLRGKVLLGCCSINICIFPPQYS